MLLKNLVIIAHNFPPESVGGASRIYEMARVLKQSYDVSVVCPPPTYPFTKYKKMRNLVQREKVNGIDVFRVWTYQPSKQVPSLFQRFLYYTISPILASFFLFRLLPNVSFVIISTPPPSLLITSLIVRFFNKRLILDVRDLWVDGVASFGYVKKDSLITKLVKKFEIYCWKNCDLIITNSMVIKDTIMRVTGIVDYSKIRYFPFNVNVEIFSRKEVKHERQIVYTGNFGKAQGLDVLIRALSIVTTHIPDLRVQIYGGGDCELELKNLVNNLGLEKVVKFNDPIPRLEIPLILSKSMLGIVSLADNESHRYAIPTKTFEYLACGLPVLAYGPSDELERIIKESRAGVFIRGNNHKEIAEEMTKLLKDEQRLSEFSLNGSEFIKRRSDFSTFLMGLDNEYSYKQN
ncbi:MAG: glycosyltransferase family 4 protein [Patescibacteria group bacterium]|nr:glycosyltransferase family 4 protein [Patescibacteria group bacterium]